MRRIIEERVLDEYKHKVRHDDNGVEVFSDWESTQDS